MDSLPPANSHEYHFTTAALNSVRNHIKHLITVTSLIRNTQFDQMSRAQFHKNRPFISCKLLNSITVTPFSFLSHLGMCIITQRLVIGYYTCT